MAEVVVDCTELFRNPVRTGIQRVVREMLRHWPADGPRLHLARFDGEGGLVALSDEVRRLLLDEAPGAAGLSHADLVRSLAEAAPARLALPAAATTLIPEVFYDPARAGFHVRRARAHQAPLAMLAYDFLPFLRPELFRLRSAVHLMGYLQAVRAASSVAFISDQTRQDYHRHVMNGRGSAAGPVLPLGADGLAMERQHWRPDRRSFVTIGSVDGRKNQHLIVAAFMPLWRSGHQAPLVLIGGVFSGLDDAWLREALAWPQFRWLERAQDADIARELRQARATIYASTAEGFGLPPVESLAAGIPVIASGELPSLQMLPTAGFSRLAEVTESSIAAAVQAMLDDEVSARLWAAAASLRLGTWRDFGRSAADWIANTL